MEEIWVNQTFWSRQAQGFVKVMHYKVSWQSLINPGHDRPRPVISFSLVEKSILTLGVNEFSQCLPTFYLEGLKGILFPLFLWAPS